MDEIQRKTQGDNQMSDLRAMGCLFLILLFFVLSFFLSILI